MTSSHSTGASKLPCEQPLSVLREIEVPFNMAVSGLSVSVLLIQDVSPRLTPLLAAALRMDFDVVLSKALSMSRKVHRAQTNAPVLLLIHILCRRYTSMGVHQLNWWPDSWTNELSQCEQF